MSLLRDRTTWLQGDQFHCLQPPAASERTWHLVLLGPPGVGKGTQTALLAAALGACPLSTGDIFRAARERAATLDTSMADAHEFVNSGRLVPDDVVLSILRDRRSCLRCHAGFLLDGFPRTLAQAVALDGLLSAERVRLDAVIHYDLPTMELAGRIAGRRMCGNCHALYHLVSRPPRTCGVCDVCGAPLLQRADDEPTAIRARLELHAAAIAPVVDYYRRRNLLLTVDAAEAPDAIFEQTLAGLADRGFRVPSAAAVAVALATA